MTALLDVSDLRVEFATRHGVVSAVQDVSFTLEKGETLGVVGESGSGKSVTSYAVMRILDRGGRIAEGRVSYAGVDLRAASEREMGAIRGREIGMIFQNPRAALNPIRKVGRQIGDVLIRHARATRQTAHDRAVEALRAVEIRNPEARAHAYPFELSGGMCQRVVIALALACDPRLLIADEPTTGLDVTTQKAVMDLIAGLTRARGMSAILITHDLGLAAAYCDRIAVMKDGQVVETAPSAQVFARPAHAYTAKLMRATARPGARLRDLLETPKPEAPRPAPGAALLVVESLAKTFADGVRAVKGVSFTIREGESLGLVGESGCGKSTTSSMVMRLLDPSSGRILLGGEDIGTVPAAHFPRDRRRGAIQMVFQDATDSLNPRFTARRAIADPLMRLTALGGRERAAKVEALAEQVGLPLHLLDRFPHQLSGGQKARVGIARALATSPKLLILDEPTAALDVSIQAVVLNLLADLRAELGMSYLFVSHDLHVVRLLCDRVMVMRGGEIVEEGDAETVMERPAHPYTRSLLDAAPVPPALAAETPLMETARCAP
ncbi:dipeptide ABC transporter ATP-binding protein [Rubrimonas cliftonensis]|uniref:Peptide/nickel transport system ATP-binding protein n=1 Tax=Rubrimonas cliftonensis TaxID=89524 RepID=A0A1H4B5X7_9RHOB|nr:ABC transporter ATP-binding protein [Rubrimonas cliftonensis]SEA43685.1 peptide/nickel transport system ATP-binding protein [Rubrimonas cliftonensis]